MVKIAMNKRFFAIWLVCILIITLCFAEETSSDPSSTPTASPSQESSPSPEATTPSPSPTPTATPSQTPATETSPPPSETNSPVPTETASPTSPAASSPDPTESTSPDPGETSSPDPTESTSPDPDATSSPDPTESTSPDPGATSSPDPTESTSPDPDATSSPDPTASTSPDPGATSSPNPTATGSPDTTTVPEYEWNLQIEGAVLDHQVWHLSYADTVNLSIVWNAYPSAEQYDLLFESDALVEPVHVSVGTSSYTLPISTIEPGLYQITITALSNRVTLAQTVCRLSIDSSSEPTSDPNPTPTLSPEPDSTVTPEPADPEKTASPSDEKDDSSDGRKFPKRPGGAWRKRPNSNSGNSSSSIVAGKALTSSHASGTGDLTPHDAIVLQIPDEEITTLMLGDTNLSFDSEPGTFTAEIEDDTLTLFSSNNDSTFSFPQAALSLLKNSGVAELCVVTPEDTVSINTSMEFSGYKYGLFRSQGYVSSDFVFHIQGTHIFVSVDQAVFQLSEDTELIPCEMPYSYSSQLGGKKP